MILQKLPDANLKLKPSKCFFLQTSVKFLGHLVNARGLETDVEKTRLINDWPVPTSCKVLGVIYLLSLSHTKTLP